MSVSYDRVNWADYPATTTPVNATNLNKMDKGIADLTREVNSVESSVSGLNSSLTASDGTEFEFCYDSTSGKYGYKDGADTFRPFSSGCGVLGCAIVGVTGSYYGVDDSGTSFVVSSGGTAANAKTALETLNWVRTATLTGNASYTTCYLTVTVDIDGYYGVMGAVYHKQAGESLPTILMSQQREVVFLGTNDPSQ